MAKWRTFCDGMLSTPPTSLLVASFFLFSLFFPSSSFDSLSLTRLRVIFSLLFFFSLFSFLFFFGACYKVTVFLSVRHYAFIRRLQRPHTATRPFAAAVLDAAESQELPPPSFFPYRFIFFFSFDYLFLFFISLSILRIGFSCLNTCSIIVRKSPKRERWTISVKPSVKLWCVCVCVCVSSFYLFLRPISFDCVFWWLNLISIFRGVSAIIVMVWIQRSISISYREKKNQNEVFEMLISLPSHTF